MTSRGGKTQNPRALRLKICWVGKIFKTLYLLVNLRSNILNEDCSLNTGGVLPGPDKSLAVVGVGGSQLSGWLLISLAESHLS